MNRVLAVIEEHAAKFGAGGTLAIVSLESISSALSVLAGALTCAALAPVVVKRWRAMLRRH